MPRNYAVVIGNNQYTAFPSLRYAKRDAELVSQFLTGSAGFDQVYLFSDDSPDIPTGNGPPLSSRPSYANLKRFLRTRVEQPF